MLGFLDASRERDRREQDEVRDQLYRERRGRRRLRRLLGVAAALLVVTVLAAVIAVSSRRTADDQRDRAQTASVVADDQRDRAQVARLVAESAAELDARLDVSLLLAAEAWRRDPGPESRGALWSALTHNVTAERDRAGAARTFGGALERTPSSFGGFVSGPVREQRAVDVSDDGRIVAGGGPAPGTDGGGIVLVFDAETGDEIRRLETTSLVLHLDVSGDGSTVMAADLESVVVVDVVSGEVTSLDLDLPADVMVGSAALAPDDDEVLVASTDGELVLWDVSAHAPMSVDLPRPPVIDAAFTADGSVVVERDGLDFETWDLDAGASIGRVALQDPGEVDRWREFTVSSDRRVIAGAQPLGRVYLWDLATGRLVGDAARRPGTSGRIAFSPVDPDLLVITSGGGFVFYDVGAERALGDPIEGSGGNIGAIGFRADGQELLTASDVGSIGRWTDNGAPNLVTTPIAPVVGNPIPSADGRRALVRLNADQLEVRSLDDLSKPGVGITSPRSAGPSVDTTTVALSADGSRALGTVVPNGPPFVADGTTGEILWTGDGLASRSDLSEDGRVVASFSGDESSLIVVDVTDGRVIADAR